MSAAAVSEALAPIEAWFAQQGWTPMAFQRQCWQAYLAGDSGLLQVPTGSGKTYAAVMGPIAEMLAAEPLPPAVPEPAVTPKVQRQDAETKPRRKAGRAATPSRGLRLLVITPLRALSRDLALAIEQPIAAMGWPLRVAIRNGEIGRAHV